MNSDSFRCVQISLMKYCTCMKRIFCFRIFIAICSIFFIIKNLRWTRQILFIDRCNNLIKIWQHIKSNYNFLVEIILNELICANDTIYNEQRIAINFFNQIAIFHNDLLWHWSFVFYNFRRIRFTHAKRSI